MPIASQQALQEANAALRLTNIYAMTQTLTGARQEGKIAEAQEGILAAVISLSAGIAGASMTRHATATWQLQCAANAQATPEHARTIILST